MSTDTRLKSLEVTVARINDLIPDLQVRLDELEQPTAQVLENPEPPPEEHDELWRIVYRHDSQAGFKPTFLQVRATNSTGALMRFIARTTGIEIDAVYEEGKGEGSPDERIKKMLDALQGKVLDAIEEGLECECPLHTAAYSAKNHNALCPYGRAVNAFKDFGESLAGNIRAQE